MAIELGRWIKLIFYDSGMTLGAFGGVAGFFALFFFGEIPRVRKDILQVCWDVIAEGWERANECGQKLPIIGEHFVHDVPPSDNVCLDFFLLVEKGIFEVPWRQGDEMGIGGCAKRLEECL